MFRKFFYEKKKKSVELNYEKTEGFHYTELLYHTPIIINGTLKSLLHNTEILVFKIYDSLLNPNIDICNSELKILHNQDENNNPYTLVYGYKYNFDYLSSIYNNYDHNDDIKNIMYTLTSNAFALGHNSDTVDLKELHYNPKRAFTINEDIQYIIFNISKEEYDILSRNISMNKFPRNLYKTDIRTDIISDNGTEYYFVSYLGDLKKILGCDAISDNTKNQIKETFVFDYSSNIESNDQYYKDIDEIID